MTRDAHSAHATTGVATTAGRLGAHCADLAARSERAAQALRALSLPTLREAS
jgi:hypothetical protein